MTTTLPTFCGPINFDMNRDWPCRRLAFVYHLHIFAADIERTEKRLARARSAYVVRNLTHWITDANVRLAKLASRIDEKVCTCPEPHEYASLREVPLPECTC